ncbi:MAG: tRNA (guanosine(37)-N1)-methyltransferase TrmD [Rhodospirillales bacterium]
MFPGPLGTSLAGKALVEGVWALESMDIRGFARDKHGSVDDTPFGGGPGMVMRPDVVGDAVQAAVVGARAGEDAVLPLVYLTPRGRPFDQQRATELAAGPGAILLCGRYEGLDQRVIEACGLEELSLGDFVLSGGEVAALAVIDACVRLLPGTMGQQESLAEESFERGLLEYPHYTRPASWTGPDGVERKVPEVLLSGHHEKVKQWRLAEAEKATRERRPDLWQRYASAAQDTKGKKS